jgi:hypothetical protein
LKLSHFCAKNTLVLIRILIDLVDWIRIQLG